MRLLSSQFWESLIPCQTNRSNIRVENVKNIRQKTPKLPLARSVQLDALQRSRSQKLLESRRCRGSGEPCLQVAARCSRARRVSQRLGDAAQERRVFCGDMKGDAGEVTLRLWTVGDDCRGLLYSFANLSEIPLPAQQLPLPASHAIPPHNHQPALAPPPRPVYTTARQLAEPS